MEVMRLSGVSTTMARIVTADFEWRGHRLKAGQILLLVILSANRDSAVFANPDQIDFARPQIDNMTFAPGLHHCIGHHMAKMQLCAFFPELLARFEAIDILDDPIQFGAGISFRGPERPRVRFHARG